jgi:hypothetical protein
MRSSAKEGLEGLLERLRRDGRISSIEALRAEMDGFDPALQERVRAWGAAPDSVEPPWAELDEETWSRPPLDGDRERFTKVLDWFERFRPRAESLASLLETGNVRLSTLAWAQPDPASGSPLFRSMVGTATWDMVAAAHWFAMAATPSHVVWLRDDGSVASGEDGREALRSLDRLLAACSPPGGSIDAHVTVFLARLRDSAYARAARRGAVDPPELERWLADPPSLHLEMAAALRAERTLLWEPVARRLLEGETLARRPWTRELDEPGDLWEQHASPWLHGREDCRRFLEYHVALEDALRTGDGAPAASAFAAVADVGWPFASWGPEGPVGHARHTASLLARTAALRRAARIATILHRDSDVLGVPATEADLRTRLVARAAWLDGGPAVYGLRYERVGDDVVRLIVVPRDPLPGLPGSSDAPVETGPTAGAPPADLSWREDRIEARVR